MNYIRQNAHDLCIGLREMKWNRLEQEMLSSPVHTPLANLHRMRPSDAQLDRLCADVVPEEYKEELQNFLTTLSPEMQDSVLRDLLPTVETADDRLQRLEEVARLLDPTTQTNVQDARLVEAVARQRELLFANEDTSHLPQQVRKQIQFIIGEFHV